MANVFGGQKLVENDDLTSVEFKVHLLLFAYLLSWDVIRKYEASLSCMSEKYGWFFNCKKLRYLYLFTLSCIQTC